MKLRPGIVPLWDGRINERDCLFFFYFRYRSHGRTPYSAFSASTDRGMLQGNRVREDMTRVVGPIRSPASSFMPARQPQSLGATWGRFPTN